MFEQVVDNEETGKKVVRHEKGVTYFTKRTEQLVLFIMTLGMLIWGAVEMITKLVAG